MEILANKPSHVLEQVALEEFRGPIANMGGKRGVLNTFLQRKVREMVRGMCMQLDAGNLDWGYIMDTDTYVNITRLQNFVSELDSTEPIYTGYCSRNIIGGGPGILLSAGALRHFLCPRLKREGCSITVRENDFRGGDAWLGECARETKLPFGHCTNEPTEKKGTYLFRRDPPWTERFVSKDLKADWSTEPISYHHVLPNKNIQGPGADPRCNLVRYKHKENPSGFITTRCTPHMLLIGVPKAGTTSLFCYLNQHPDFIPPLHKELHLFAPIMAPGREIAVKGGGRNTLSRYLNQLPIMDPRSGKITGEASPSYFYSLKAPTFFKKNFKTVKLILLLRDPVDRAFSEYLNKLKSPAVAMNQFIWLKKGDDILGGQRDYFGRVARAALERKRRCGESGLVFDPAALGRDCYLPPIIWQGLYHQHLKRWVQAYGKEDLMLACHSDLGDSTQDLMRKVTEHVGLPAFEYNLSLAYNTASHRGADCSAAFSHKWDSFSRPILFNKLWKTAAVSNKTNNSVHFQSAKKDRPAVDADIRGMLKRFYAPSVAALRRQFAEHGYSECPWMAAYS
ncbi:hypothetical protein CYMTET_25953 [Cymbomonas tetramitiformis]|uniref:Sulfotransferase n=1 Tax=Cymbomonas tetramitiformis TaxID=36881 RepID=A0AAE0FUC7_9CHLO|nr:hypothetical protein CYMTET_47791 [Cymbomonas tetramitiformis]KAK3265356.1 hypothetical protein CYMTET_25953 [Cymbomonas tetramitiformis]